MVEQLFRRFRMWRILHERDSHRNVQRAERVFSLVGIDNGERCTALDRLDRIARARETKSEATAGDGLSHFPIREQNAGIALDRHEKLTSLHVAPRLKQTSCVRGRESAERLGNASPFVPLRVGEIIDRFGPACFGDLIRIDHQHAGFAGDCIPGVLR